MRDLGINGSRDLGIRVEWEAAVTDLAGTASRLSELLAVLEEKEREKVSRCASVRSSFRVPGFSGPCRCSLASMQVVGCARGQRDGQGRHQVGGWGWGWGWGWAE